MTTIGSKKQIPNAVNISSRKDHSIYHPPRKIAPITTYPAETVRSNKSLLNDQSYAVLPVINPVLKSINSSTTALRPYHDRRLCSVRSGIATFIIIVILIIAAAISIGIVFGVIKSQNSSTTENNNQNSLATVSTGSLASSVSIGSQIGLPCSGYTEINDPTRSISQVGTYGACDTGYLFNMSNGGSWIRFVGSGGTALPVSSPGLNQCGAFLAGWYNSTLPTTPNTITNGTVCFETYSGTCGVSVDISVVLCSPGGYYVFFLPPVRGCNSRYCTV